LPPDRPAFPNRTLSLFSRTAEFAYGKRTVPLSPDRSTQFGAPASVVTHTFFVSNATPMPARFTFSILGTQWQPAPVPPPAIDLDTEAAKGKEVEVQVAIPAGRPLGSSDRGFLKLEISTQPGIEYTAEFVTFAGTGAVPGERLQLIWEYWN